MTTPSPNTFEQMETQAPTITLARLTLKADDVVKGQVQPGHTEPEGIMLKGPFEALPWFVTFREQYGTVSAVGIYYTFNLDYLQADITATVALSPNLQFTDAATTWTGLTTVTLAPLGETFYTIDWANDIAEARPPTAVRFCFMRSTGKEVRIEVKNRIL